jgi:hypothetical protein
MQVFLVDAVNVFLSILVCVCFVDARWLTVCHAWLQPEMIDWEVRGTLNVVEACANAAVKRLVLTSSLSAMVWDHQRTPGACIDEKCWSNLDFCRSKKVWQFYPGHPFHHHKILSRFSIFSAEGNLLDDQITLKLCKLSVFCQRIMNQFYHGPRTWEQDRVESGCISAQPYYCLCSFYTSKFLVEILLEHHTCSIPAMSKRQFLVYPMTLL